MPAACDALIAQLKELHARTLAEEEEEYCREEEALRQAKGTFPVLDEPQHTLQPLHGARGKGMDVWAQISMDGAQGEAQGGA